MRMNASPGGVASAGRLFQRALENTPVYTRADAPEHLRRLMVPRHCELDVDGIVGGIDFPLEGAPFTRDDVRRVALALAAKGKADGEASPSDDLVLALLDSCNDSLSAHSDASGSGAAPAPHRVDRLARLVHGRVSRRGVLRSSDPAHQGRGQVSPDRDWRLHRPTHVPARMRLRRRGATARPSSTLARRSTRWACRTAARRSFTSWRRARATSSPVPS